MLVSRYYVERLGGQRRVERLILMGGPHQGVPKAAASLVLGPNLLPFGLLGDRLRDVMATFPSSYQILPTYACALDQDGKNYDLFSADAWLTEAQRPLIAQAREFRRELGHQSSVPAVSIFGYGLETITELKVQRGQGDVLSQFKLKAERDGDSTIPSTTTRLRLTTRLRQVHFWNAQTPGGRHVECKRKVESTLHSPGTTQHARSKPAAESGDVGTGSPRIGDL